MTDVPPSPPPAPPKRYGVFDAEGAPLAFYGDDIWDGSTERLTMPTGTIPLTEVQYRQLLNNQPLSRFVDGEVVVLDVKDLPPPPPPPENPLDKVAAALDAINRRLDKLESK